jgi:hypothetical protein
MEQVHDHLNRLHAANDRYLGSFWPAVTLWTLACKMRPGPFCPRPCDGGIRCRYPFEIKTCFSCHDGAAAVSGAASACGGGYVIVDDNARLRLATTPTGSFPAKSGLPGEALAVLVV